MYPNPSSAQIQHITLYNCNQHIRHTSSKFRIVCQVNFFIPKLLSYLINRSSTPTTSFLKKSSGAMHIYNNHVHRSGCFNLAHHFLLTSKLSIFCCLFLQELHSVCTNISWSTLLKSFNYSNSHSKPAGPSQTGIRSSKKTPAVVLMSESIFPLAMKM